MVTWWCYEDSNYTEVFSTSQYAELKLWESVLSIMVEKNLRAPQNKIVII